MIHFGGPVRQGRRGQPSQERPAPARLALLDARQQQDAQGWPPAVVVPERIAKLPGRGLRTIPLRMDQRAAAAPALRQGQQTAPAAGTKSRLRARAHGVETAPAQEQGTPRLGQSHLEEGRKHGA